MNRSSLEAMTPCRWNAVCPSGLVISDNGLLSRWSLKSCTVSNTYQQGPCVYFHFYTILLKSKIRIKANMLGFMYMPADRHPGTHSADLIEVFSFHYIMWSSVSCSSLGNPVVGISFHSYSPSLLPHPDTVWGCSTRSPHKVFEKNKQWGGVRQRLRSAHM